MPTTFDNLPQQVDHLLTEVLLIKKILLDRNEKPEEVPKKFLSSKEALSELKAMGYSMSWSKFTKMVASRIVPCKKVNNKLLFNKEELRKWFDNQLDNSSELNCLSTTSITNSARSKQHKNYYGK
jgi:hypothetical protein